MNNLQQDALRILKSHSIEYPITARFLAEQLGIKKQLKGQEQANVRSVVHALRIQRFPICSSSKGYWIARSQRELDDSISDIQGRINSMQEMVSGLRESVIEEEKESTEEERKKTTYQQYLS